MVSRSIEGSSQGLDRPCLSVAQRRALQYVKAHADSRQREAQKTVAGVLQRAGVTEERFGDALSRFLGNLQIALHFHPDRLTSVGESVAQSLLRDGLYRSQFETGDRKSVV